jgi:aminoglycoside phosphotransferase (APT) family kinase protein
VSNSPRQTARSAAVSAARALRVPEETLSPLPGESQQTWSAGEHILRIRPTAAVDAEVAAHAAAGRVIATPEVLDRVDLDTFSAILVRRLPGVPAGHLEGITLEQARARGRACGSLHSILATVAAPVAVAQAPQLGDSQRIAGTRDEDRLLHLDLHPFNVLVVGDSVSGVIDWANAAVGHPDLDRARSMTILTLHPLAVALNGDPRMTALAEGWIESGDLLDVPPAARAWACRFMLSDLADRNSPTELASVQDALDAAEAQADGA